MMNPASTHFRCCLNTTGRSFYSNWKIKVEGKPTLDKILTIFENRLETLSAINEVPRAVKQLPRILEYQETSLRTDEELIKTIEQLKSAGITEPVFKLPYSFRQLFKSDIYSNPYCSKALYEDLKGQFDDDLNLSDKGTFLPGVVIDTIITFANNGLVAWPPHLKYVCKVFPAWHRLKLERTEFALENEEEIPVEAMYKVPLKISSPLKPGEYRISTQLMTSGGNTFGKKVNMPFRVQTRERINEIIEQKTSLRPDHEHSRLQIVEERLLTRLNQLKSEPNPMSPNMKMLSSMAIYEPFENDVLYPDVSAIFYTNVSLSHPLTLGNDGKMNWEPGIHLESHLISLMNDQVKKDQHPIPLKAPLASDDTIDITLRFTTPFESGAYIIALRVVTKDGLDFGDTIYLPFHVIDPPQEAALGLFGPKVKQAHLTRMGYDPANALIALEKNDYDLNNSLGDLLTDAI